MALCDLFYVKRNEENNNKNSTFKTYIEFAVIEKQKQNKTYHFVNT